MLMLIMNRIVIKLHSLSFLAHGKDGNKSSENNDSLEVQLKDAQYTLTESETKFETMARKLNTVEAEGQRSEVRDRNYRCLYYD